MHSSSTPPPVEDAHIYPPIASVWTPEQYAEPNAPPSRLAAESGRRLAAQLLQHQGLYVSDHRASVMVYVSEGIERLLGHSAADFAAGQYALIHPEDLPLVTAVTVLSTDTLRNMPATRCRDSGCRWTTASAMPRATTCACYGRI